MPPYAIGLATRLSRLELVWETSRVAFRALVDADASWVNKHLPISFVDSYIQWRWDFRLSKAKIRQWMREAGQEGYWILDQAEGHGSGKLKALTDHQPPKKKIVVPDRLVNLVA